MSDTNIKPRCDVDELAKLYKRLTGKEMPSDELMNSESVICIDGVTRRVRGDVLTTGPHREAYPELTEHPRLGELVSVVHARTEGGRGRIIRIVGSRHGALCKLDDGSPRGNNFWNLSCCFKVVVH